MMEERDFRRGELPGKYTVKMLYGWDDRKFEEKYLRKLEKKLVKMEVSFSRKQTLKRGVMSELKTIDLIYFISHFYFLYFSFLFIFLFSDLEFRFSMMLYITVTLEEIATASMTQCEQLIC